MTKIGTGLWSPAIYDAFKLAGRGRFTAAVIVPLFRELYHKHDHRTSTQSRR
jgi:hypothetical protein